MFGVFKRWKPKGQMYSLRCFQCRSGFLSSFNLEAPICGKCLQKTKSLDSTVDYEKICGKCGNRGVIYRKGVEFLYFIGAAKNTNWWVMVYPVKEKDKADWPRAQLNQNAL